MCDVFSDCNFYDTLVIPNVRSFVCRLSDTETWYNAALCVMAETFLFYNTRVTYRHLESKRSSAHLLHAIYLLWCSRLLIGFITRYFRNWTSAKKCIYSLTQRNISSSTIVALRFLRHWWILSVCEMLLGLYEMMKYISCFCKVQQRDKFYKYQITNLARFC